MYMTFRLMWNGFAISLESIENVKRLVVLMASMFKETVRGCMRSFWVYMLMSITTFDPSLNDSILGNHRKKPNPDFVKAQISRD